VILPFFTFCAVVEIDVVNDFCALVVVICPLYNGQLGLAIPLRVNAVRAGKAGA